MEKYYESYILAEVNKEGNPLFNPLLNSNPQDSFHTLENCLQTESFPKKFNSIIDADIYLFGLIYYTIAKDKSISITEHVFSEIQEKVQEFKKDENTLFLVAGDASVPYEEVIKGIVLLKEAGIEKAGLMTQGQ